MTTSMRVDHAALFAILSSLADNKQAIGRRYAYWCTGAPVLEAAVAAAAMTQDELGHARTLYPLLADFVQAEVDPVQVEPVTRTLHYHLAVLDQEFASWCDFVAANFLVDTAFTTFFEAMQVSSFKPLRARSRKIVQEEQLHQIHGEGWVRKLAGAGGAVPKALRSALQRCWDETLCWFGPSDDAVMQRLWHDGIIDATPDELCNRYLQKIMPVLSDLGLGMPVAFDVETRSWELTQPLPWSWWKATERRLERA